MSKSKYFRAPVSRGIKSTTGFVDRENQVIRGFSVISTGEAQGHNQEIDKTTLEMVAELGNASNLGIKSRFGHPAMSGSAIGTHLGRIKNFSIDNDRVRADLHISDVAFESPTGGNLGKYVMDLAEKDPDAFGASIVFPIGDTDDNPNEDGLKNEEGQLMPVTRPTQLRGVDVVDEAATGDGFFESFFGDSVKLSAEMSERLSEFLSQPEAAENIQLFINKYVENEKHKQKLLQSVQKVVDMKDENKNTKLKFTLDKEKEMEKEVKKEKTPEEISFTEAQMNERLELAVVQEQERINEITATCDSFNLKKEFAAGLIKDKIELSAARKAMMDEHKKDLEKGSAAQTKITLDNIDNQRTAMINALLVRGGVEDSPEIRTDVRKTQFAGLTLQSLAKYCLQEDGINNVMMMDGQQLFEQVSKNRYFAQAPTQGSGDFVNVLSNVLNKSAGKGWQLAESTFERWVSTGTLKDFKTADIPRLTEMGDLKEIHEGEAPEMQKMADFKETARLKTWGGKYILSRQAMVNDDMSMLTDVPMKYARALKRLMNKRCYNLLYDDNGAGTTYLGPTMNEDSIALFNAASHFNFVAAASGAVPGQATLDVAFKAMANQLSPTPDNDDSDSIRLNIVPKYILIGPNYDLETFKLMNNIGYNVSGEDSAALGSNAANMHGPGGPRNLVIVSDAELDNIDASYYPWYLAADANDVDTVKLWTLNGNSSPFTDTAPTPTGDARGMIWVIEHDYVFSVPDWRGLYCNTGEAK